MKKIFWVIALSSISLRIFLWLIKYIDPTIHAQIDLEQAMNYTLNLSYLGVILLISLHIAEMITSDGSQMIKIFGARIVNEQSKEVELAKLEAEVNEFVRTHPKAKTEFYQSSDNLTTITCVITYTY